MKVKHPTIKGLEFEIDPAKQDEWTGQGWLTTKKTTSRNTPPPAAPDKETSNGE